MDETTKEVIILKRHKSFFAVLVVLVVEACTSINFKHYRREIWIPLAAYTDVIQPAVQTMPELPPAHNFETTQIRHIHES